MRVGVRRPNMGILMFRRTNPAVPAYLNPPQMEHWMRATLWFMVYLSPFVELLLTRFRV